ncbi:MAG: enoyl-CoA hydratase/isomerase family protein, partial [Mesorhizobium sp.]
LTAHAVSGDLAAGLTMERDILGDLYRGEIGQRRVREFAERSIAKVKKAGQ